MTNTPGWAIELDGDKIDIDDLRYLPPAPFDPWVEDYPTDDGHSSLGDEFSPVRSITSVCSGPLVLL
jgi:hypothetical protein